MMNDADACSQMINGVRRKRQPLIHPRLETRISEKEASPDWHLR